MPGSAGSRRLGSKAEHSGLATTPTPAPASVRKLFFGCNLLPQRLPLGGGAGATSGRERSANSYTLLATPLAVNAKVIEEEQKTLSSQKMAVSELPPPPYQALPDKAAQSAVDVSEVPPSLTHSPGGGAVADLLAGPRSPTEGNSRIEDSVEALDKLEEQLEALDQAMSPQTLGLASDGEELVATKKSPAAATRTASGSKPNTPAKATPGTASRSKATTTATTAARPAAMRKSMPPMALSSETRAALAAASGTTKAKEDDGAKPAGAAPPTRRVARPASLLPPKPPAKSTKPPTVSTFELPGAVVARRLREQREARLSLLGAAPPPTPERSRALAAAGAPPRPKSTKVPTRPTFELPGEAISRRKREERDARLAREAEEQKKRREFKARPVRHSMMGPMPTASSGNATAAPASTAVYPRETLASRARLATNGAENNAATTTATTTGANRQAVAAGVAAAKGKVGAGINAATFTPATTAQTARAPLSTTATTNTTRPHGAAPARGRIVNGSSSGTASTTVSRAPTTRETSVAASSVSSGSGTGGGGSGTPRGAPRAPRSHVSAEEAAAQKQRGREALHASERSFREERERERREREDNARLARAAAAERERAKGREWADKQRRARKSAVVGVGNAVGGAKPAAAVGNNSRNSILVGVDATAEGVVAHEEHATATAAEGHTTPRTVEA